MDNSITLERVSEDELITLICVLYKNQLSYEKTKVGLNSWKIKIFKNEKENVK